MAKDIVRLGRGSEEVVSDGDVLHKGDKVRVVSILTGPVDDKRRTLPRPSFREVTSANADEVLFAPVGFDPETCVHSTAMPKSIDDVSDWGQIPEHFILPMHLLRELMQNHGWSVVERADGTLVDAIRKAVGKAAQLPVVPAVGTARVDEATCFGRLADLENPLVGSGPVQEAPLADAAQIEVEVKAAGRKLEETLRSLESVLNLRPEQVGVAGVRGSIQVVLTNKHLLGVAGRKRIVALNGRLTEIYNRTQKPGVLEVIHAINDLLALLPRN